MGIIIFDRTNKGIEVSKDGAIFLGYARQVLEQASLLEERYKLQAGGKKDLVSLHNIILSQSMHLLT